MLRPEADNFQNFPVLKMFSLLTGVEKQEKFRVFAGKDLKKNKIGFFVLTCGLCSSKVVVSWQKFELASHFQPDSSGLASLSDPYRDRDATLSFASQPHR